MLLLWIWYWIHSLLACHGTHDFGKVREFIVDPHGPVDHSMPTLAGGSMRGTWVTFGRCRRCSRREDGKGFDY